MLARSKGRLNLCRVVNAVTATRTDYNNTRQASVDACNRKSLENSQPSAEAIDCHNRGRNGAKSSRGFAASLEGELEGKPQLVKYGQSRSEKTSAEVVENGQQAGSERKGKRGSKQSAWEAASGISFPALKERWKASKQRIAAGEVALEDCLSLQKGHEFVGVSAYDFKIMYRSLDRFQRSSLVKDQALALYVSTRAFDSIAEQFREFVLLASDPSFVLKLGSASRLERASLLFSLFAEYVVDQHKDILRSQREIISTLDLRKPHLWYPRARSLKRKIIYHAGPTNSGKTYTAMQAMMSAGSGVYCGPLRLLAMEVYDECNAAGTYCNLITGQERKLVPGAEHTSCTVEVMSLHKEVDVAVIDEIQLLGDGQRGWAWTRAFQGAPAKEIHLCGDISALQLIKKLAKQMNEEVELREYKRFTPLKVADSALHNGWRGIQSGDCVVAYSRKKIFKIKSLIEACTGKRASLIYGALPPETRRNQAKQFNLRENGADVMVASDAIGMGLNLNIKRVIFSSLHKVRDGHSTLISASAMKQIAGRAGRRNSDFPEGSVTCIREDDMGVLKKGMSSKMSQKSTSAAGLLPTYEQIEAYATQALQTDLPEILAHFLASAKLDGTYFLCGQDDVLWAAELLNGVADLSLQDRYDFCISPFNPHDPQQAAALLHFAHTHAAKQPVELHLNIPKQSPQTPEDLQHIERIHQIASLWLWLSGKHEDNFPDRQRVEELALDLTRQMDAGLRQITADRDPKLIQPKGQSPQQQLRTALDGIQTPIIGNLCGPAYRLLAKENEKHVKAVHFRFRRQERMGHIEHVAGRRRDLRGDLWQQEPQHPALMWAGAS